MTDTYVVERSETIAARPAAIFDRVRTLQGWDDWSPWAQMDPDMTKTYDGEPGAVGSSYHWTGNRKVGEGQMTVTASEPNKRIAIDLAFIKPFKSESVTEMLLAPAGDNTEVTWRMTGEKSLMIKVFGLIGRGMDKMVGPDFDQGLAKLKRLVETTSV